MQHKSSHAFKKNSINVAPSMGTQPLFPLETAALKTSPVTNFSFTVSMK